MQDISAAVVFFVGIFVTLNYCQELEVDINYILFNQKKMKRKLIMENISRKERTGHKYIPGTANEVERQHVNEHESLQLLQRYALNGKREEFFTLLDSLNLSKDKHNDILELTNMN